MKVDGVIMPNEEDNMEMFVEAVVFAVPENGDKVPLELLLTKEEFINGLARAKKAEVAEKVIRKPKEDPKLRKVPCPNCGRREDHDAEFCT